MKKEELVNILDGINKDKISNEIINSLFKELKNDKVVSPRELIKFYRLYLDSFSIETAKDLIIEKMILVKAFKVKSYVNFCKELDGLNLHDTLFTFEMNEKIENSKMFLIESLQSHLKKFESDFIPIPKVLWNKNVSELGAVFHYLYDNQYFDCSKEQFISWIENSINFKGSISTVRDIVKKGEEKYPSNFNI